VLDEVVCVGVDGFGVGGVVVFCVLPFVYLVELDFYLVVILDGVHSYWGYLAAVAAFEAV
jgi:hypothetical protein